MKPFATYFSQVFIMFQHYSEHILLNDVIDQQWSGLAVIN